MSGEHDQRPARVATMGRPSLEAREGCRPPREETIPIAVSVPLGGYGLGVVGQRKKITAVPLDCA